MQTAWMPEYAAYMIEGDFKEFLWAKKLSPTVSFCHGSNTREGTTVWLVRHEL